jgi:thioesterase domain-containing protein
MKPRDPIELLVARAWSDALRQPSVDVRAPFARLGGDDDARRRMLARVAREAGLGAVPDAAARAETVEALALALKRASGELRRQARAFWARNVDSPAGSGRPPLFLFHGMRAGGREWFQLADQFGLDQPIYGIAPHFAWDEPVPDTLAGIARDHLRVVRSIQPAGPYLLGGFCNGAVAAFEAAAQLVAEGVDVTGLLLVAPRLPGAYRRGPFGLFVRLTLRPIDAALAPVHKLGLRHRLWRALGSTNPGAGWRHPVRLPSEQDDVEMAQRYADIYEPYAPAPLSVPAAIFWPRRQPWRCRTPSQWAWRRALPTARVVEVPGRHADCTRGEPGRVTVREMRRAIDLFLHESRVM